MKIYTYVLRMNHIHLLLIPTTPIGTSKLMPSLGCYYVRYYNNTYQGAGSLWEGGYKSTLVDTWQ
ncbi:transposase [Pseudoalteromonas luteoviolacea]|uniref:transposase n=2 Tax=Pseudoalteromonas luteoviolacea TaxID=43657 RepID=UPI0009BFB319|nr:transposase [Pseudoalteromonas luteoviolacea]MBQ4906290.1 transposase [Pseudoalteromonas luteoviolacea]